MLRGSRVLAPLPSGEPWRPRRAGFGAEYDVDIRRGSIFRRSRAAVQRAFGSREVQARLVNLSARSNWPSSTSVVRNLSQVEVRALDRFPEIQTKTEQAFAALATAVESMDEPDGRHDPARLGGSADAV
ncbi:hypothetical protein [Pseudosporangium ferrugineum]|uniref:hypothetical protein n=1 Tax=Pseudosporangium ferrugineum TaxID=439699 RepID=UPI0011B24BE6|nr:hypothetical protein [Pseudosporangium ferrugineum]